MDRLLRLLARIAFAFAALWSIIAGLWIAFTPLTVQSVTISQSAGGETTYEQATKQISWYSAQGAWGIIILFIFAGIYTAAAVFAWRSKAWPAGILSILAILLTILAGFSIGPYYLPAAVAVFIGTLLIFGKLLIQTRKRPEDQTPGSTNG